MRAAPRKAVATFAPSVYDYPLQVYQSPRRSRQLLAFLLNAVIELELIQMHVMPSHLRLLHHCQICDFAWRRVASWCFHRWISYPVYWTIPSDVSMRVLHQVTSAGVGVWGPGEDEDEMEKAENTIARLECTT